MLIIYSTLSVLRPITTYLREQNILRVTCGLIVVIVSGLIIYVLWRQLKAAPLLLLRNTLLLALLFAPVALWLKLPEERMHLVEYSLLTPLLILALRDKLQGTRLFLVYSQSAHYSQRLMKESSTYSRIAMENGVT